MSHVTSGQGQDTFAWLGQSPAGSSRKNSKGGPRSVAHPQLNDRSVETITTSHNPFATFSTDESTSSFDFSHLTPEQSADETFHTPELDDLLWQVEREDSSAEMNNDHAQYEYTSGGAAQTRLHPNESNTYIHHLPSPQLTNTSTPEALGHSKKISQASNLLASPMTSPQQLKRPLTFIDTDISHQDDADLDYSHPPSSRVVSPMITFSKHTRGDSPARTDFEGPRLNKKRSASSLSHGGYFPNPNETTSSSMLMPPSDHLGEEEEEEEWEDQGTERAGVAPAERDSENIQSTEDMENQKQHEETIHEVQFWLERTSIDPDGAARRNARLQNRPDRMRSRSTGTRTQVVQERGLDDSHIPGPGRLVDEESDYYYSDHESEDSSSEYYPETLQTELPQRKDSAEIPPEQLEPLPSQFYRRGPWQDSFPARVPTENGRYQPDTSSAAMYKFQQRAKNFETASRAATWGTGRFSRRLSDGEIDSILTDGKATRHLSLSKRTRERGASILNELKTKTRESIIKRTNSHQRKHSHQGHELEKVQSPEPLDERSSTDSIHQTQTNSSYSKPKSPSLSTSTAFMAVTGNLAAVGAGSTGLNMEPQRTGSLIKRTMKRVRSRSDVNKSPKSHTGLSGLLAQQGGMPVPALASPSHESPAVSLLTPPLVDQAVSPQAEVPVKMDLKPRSANIIPNLDGFKSRIRELNPRLEPYLIDRIAHDQIRRYKRLVKNKVDHSSAVAEHRCTSGSLCPAVGGEAEILPARNGGRDAASSSAQFKVAAGVDSDNDESQFDGIVSPALFPDGIPLPPTKRLPARFECYLCFQVKSFQKPSDWTKHVHEDVQPFTCTFPQCSEPKSFKRKADWVRHENERHRHLEWWQCNIQECQHKCFRKDNFVQHLVREHKRKEPKIKGRTNSGVKGKGKNAATNFNQEERDFWDLVDACRHEGANDSKSEPCKFCGNVCASWKKLSVHVGKHMEEIAMPVWELAQKRVVTKDTIISPVEPMPSRNLGFTGMDQSMTGEFNANAMSPYTQSGASNYQSSSASHSPAVMHNHLQQPGMLPNQTYLGTTYPTNEMRQGSLTSAPYTVQGPYATAMNYNTYAANAQFAQYNTHPGMYSQSQMSANQGVPTTQPIDGGYMIMQSPYEPQPSYFSSPEVEQRPYMDFQSNNIQGDNMMGHSQMVQERMSTSATTRGVNHDYSYAHAHGHAQPHGNTGHHYYQS
ncbi:hypothetical protein H2198_002358 [Neophaeococcomyces mojaviensis]|uniref:Uncharacterized protein n=1 Tax=Neophaeococcomyces mojaviensis TaxID=3383035 RepID=A0ACC3AEZ1_9EURO|nr:hypothetical protein H2198_002358 [Knufia sp. JES_112]